MKSKQPRVTRDDPRWQVPGSPPLPSWLETIRPHQTRVTREVAEAFERGAGVVFLDAPTGSGKSLIGELVRREMDVERGLYLCTTKALQDQYLRDFDYARVLKGRTNYLPTRYEAAGRWGGSGAGKLARAGLEVTCADCDKGPGGVPAVEQSCSYCWEVETCPYQVARREAAMAPVGVLNTSYFLASVNGGARSPFAARELVVADECDTLEQQLMGYVELRIGRRMQQKLGVEVPKKGSHMSTLRAWLGEDVLGAVEDQMKRLGGGLEDRRERRRLEDLKGRVKVVIAREEGWVRDNGEEEGRYGDALVLKPVDVRDVAGDVLWRHGEKWLCMTGTLASAEMEAEALGLEEAGVGWDVVEAPMLFAKEHRRVVLVPAGLMTRKGQEDGALERVMDVLVNVLRRHEGENVLVHCHTYKLTREIRERLKGHTGGRPVYSYLESRDKDHALEKFKAEAGGSGAVLVAASMDRGVDLPGDLCRAQVIVKMPYPSLGDRQVSERMRGPGGQLWYTVQVVRGVLQMCGRAVRGEDDWAVTYILDAQMGSLYKEGKRMGLWPQWWVEGFETARVKEYQ